MKKETYAFRFTGFLTGVRDSNLFEGSLAGGGTERAYPSPEGDLKVRKNILNNACNYSAGKPGSEKSKVPNRGVTMRPGRTFEGEIVSPDHIEPIASVSGIFPE
jgi:hypothetical protein